MKISIIIPSFNRAKLLNKTLESIACQTSSEWECIVVDDFSSDNTKEVVSRFVDEGYSVFYYLNEHKKGAQGARNTGLDHAQYEWVMFFDSDNILHSNFIEVMADNIRSDIDVLACCSEVINFYSGKTGRVMNPGCRGYIHDSLFLGNSYVDFNQAIIRKSKLIEIEALDEDCPSMQEWDTHIRLSKIAKYDMIDNCLVDYYQGGDDTISSNLKREVIGRLYILRKHVREWRTHPWGMTAFCYQINSLIARIDDQVFVKEKKQELYSLVPLAKVRIHIVSYLFAIRNLIRKQ